MIFLKWLVTGYLFLQHTQCIFTAPKETRSMNTKKLSLYGIQMY